MHTSVDGAGSFPSRPLAGRVASEASRVGGLLLARSKISPPTPPAFAPLMRSTLPANRSRMFPTSARLKMPNSGKPEVGGREGTAIAMCASTSDQAGRWRGLFLRSHIDDAAGLAGGALDL